MESDPSKKHGDTVARARAQERGRGGEKRREKSADYAGNFQDWQETHVDNRRGVAAGRYHFSSLLKDDLQYRTVLRASGHVLFFFAYDDGTVRTNGVGLDREKDER